MRKMKKAAAFLMAAILSVSCVTPAFAADTAAAIKQQAEKKRVKEGWVKVKGVYRWRLSDGSYLKKKGWQTLGGSTYYLNKDGSRKTGWVKSGGKRYYLAKNGKLVQDKLGYKIGKNYYKIDKKGIAVKVSEAEGLAGIRLEKCGRNLRKALRWSAGLKYYPDCGKPGKGQKEADYYAAYGFKYNQGDCYVMACTFYWMAKVSGKNVHYVKGYVKQREGYGEHGWCEIVEGGKTYVYDPDLYTLTKGKKGFKFTYGEKGTYQYDMNRITRVN